MADVTAFPQSAPRAATGRPRVPVLVVLSAVIALCVLIMIVAGQWLTPYDPSQQDLFNASSGPTQGHLLGTDSSGRDVLSLLIAGAQTAVLGPLVIAFGTVLIGATLGLLAGWKGGIVDSLLSRFADLMYALPGMLVVVVVVGIIGGGYWIAVAVLLLLSIPGEIRMCRSAAVVQASLPYVEAARTLGLSSGRVMFGHILPNIVPTILATFLLDFVGALLGLSGLSFLGLGAPAGTPDWGSLLQDGRSVLAVNPWASLAPGLMIVLTATSVTLIGDWVYDHYTKRGEQR